MSLKARDLLPILNQDDDEEEEKEEKEEKTEEEVESMMEDIEGEEEAEI